MLRCVLIGCVLLHTENTHDDTTPVPKDIQTCDVSFALELFKRGDQHVWLITIASPLGGTKTVDDIALPSAAEFDYVRFFAQ
jgi:hypothetical protein